MYFARQRERKRLFAVIQQIVICLNNKKMLVMRIYVNRISDMKAANSIYQMYLRYLC